MHCQAERHLFPSLVKEGLGGWLVFANVRYRGKQNSDSYAPHGSQKVTKQEGTKMETLRWNNRFSVGNQEIDLQHKMLFNLINYLVSNSGRACKRHEMPEILEELIAYTDYHFTAEEAFLEGHPTFAAHRAAHAEFIGKTRLFKKAFMEKKEEINGDLFAYLVKWMREHVLETDCLFFQEQFKKQPLVHQE